MTGNRRRVQYRSTELWTTCEPCDKRAYASARDARRASRRHPGDVHMSVYRCPVDPDRWHIGHLPASVRRGESSKDSYQRAVDKRRARSGGQR